MARPWQFEQERNEQALTLERRGREALQDPFEQHPFVGDVLVDDHETLVVDGDDVRVSELPQWLQDAVETNRRHVRHDGGDLASAQRSGPVDARVPRQQATSPAGPGPPMRRPCAPAGRTPAEGPGGRLAHAKPWHPCGAQGGADAAPHDFMDERLIRKPDFGLGGMHVHVDAVERDLEEEMNLRAALLDRGRLVGVDDRVGNRLVLHDAAIHEQVLRAARGSLVGQGRHDAGQAQPVRLPIDGRRDPADRHRPDRAGRRAWRPVDTRAGGGLRS